MLLTLSLGEAIGARQAGGGRRPGLSERRTSATPTALTAARPGLLPAAPLPRRRERLSLLSNAGLAGSGHLCVSISRGQPLSPRLLPRLIEQETHPTLRPAAGLQKSGPSKVPLLPPNKASLELTLPLGGGSYNCPRGRPEPRSTETGARGPGPTVRVTAGRGLPTCAGAHATQRTLPPTLPLERAPAFLSPLVALGPSSPETADAKTRSGLARASLALSPPTSGMLCTRVLHTPGARTETRRAPTRARAPRSHHRVSARPPGPSLRLPTVRHAQCAQGAARAPAPPSVWPRPARRCALQPGRSLCASRMGVAAVRGCEWTSGRPRRAAPPHGSSTDRPGARAKRKALRGGPE
ncbi:uncharacterized protein LOC115072275 [Nannospalax galili]|uniref:uncharacterized protein LOC115072275 n=1 Tax=Nannospalax galili TaxID=1026970 RepID=UPI00111C6495|nr:uncharacterized protein LOC115072275 [Nannospalax galili]